MARIQRTFDTVMAAARRVLEWIESADPDPQAPTVLTGWDLTALVAHLGAVVDTTVQTLGRGSRANLISVGRYLTAYGPAASEVASRELHRADRSGWPGVVTDLRRSVADLAVLDAATLPAKVEGPRGTLRTEDFMATRVVELVVHADDLHRSIPDREPVGFTRAELTMALRTLAQALGDNHPGHTIEVRVPPYTAVQCGIPGDGPTHTRGTPPNVVETDGTTFLRLATGRLSWADAVAQRRVSASGNRADLSALLPLW